jgi:hypothetical protein
LAVALSLRAAGITLDLPWPWWLAQAIVPLALALVVVLTIRGASWARWCGATVSLWAVHLALAAAIQRVTGAGLILPPPVLPALVGVPLLLIPLRDVVAPPRRAREQRARVEGVELRPPPARGETATSRASVDAPSRGSSPFSRPRKSESAGDAVRISFERIAEQLPARLFQAPLDRVAAELAEPGCLVVPRALVTPQLAEGVVRVGWDVVADQFPRALLAVADDEVKSELPGGQLVLPLDEIVSQIQIPLELRRADRPPLVLSGIENFPEPFQKIVRECPDESVETLVETVVAPSVTNASGETAPEPAIVERRADPVIEERREQEASRLETSARGSERLEAPAVTADAKTPLIDQSPALRQPFGPEARGAGTIDRPKGMHIRAAADPPTAGSRIGDPPVASGGPEVGTSARRSIDASITAGDDAPSGAVRGGLEIADARRIAARLAPLVSHDVAAQVTDGVMLYTISSPGPNQDQSIAAARALLPLFADSRAPWPVDQLTLKGPDSAVVVTPLAPPATGGPVLVFSATRGGSLALLEILSRRAAAAYEATAPPSGAAETILPRAGNTPVLVDVDTDTRPGRTTPPLGAVGLVTGSELLDSETGQTLHLFLPSGSDTRAIGAFVTHVARAVRQAAGSGIGFDRAVLRSGRHRMIIRLPNRGGRYARIVAAAGDGDRPGLAYRQVEWAALTVAAS